MSEREEILAELAPLIERARREGKWLWCNYQDLWFSPDGLAKQNAKGSFIWGSTNWKLRDPQERLVEADKRVAAAEADRDRMRSYTGEWP